jgi:hypothetical protein
MIGLRFIDHRGHLRRGAVAAAVVLLTLALTSSVSQARVSAARGAQATPTIHAYWTGVFHWSAVRKVDHYQFELASDRQFHSPALGGAGNFSTLSTSATLSHTRPDGTYWWRVRGIHKNGSVSKWVTHSFKKVWNTAPKLLSPANGASINFPTNPLLLSWTPVLGAVRYEVAIARDPKMTSLVSGVQTVTTAASYIPPTTLAQGTYYWTVTPVDADKHEGATSVVRSFTWGWPTQTHTSLQDLVTAPEFFDPLLSWTPVPGAAKYELDVNFSQDFNTSSRVYSATTVATGFSPIKPLPNNTYYWRVRPINAQGDDGVWTQGSSFTQFFDTSPPLVGPTVSGLHMRDELSDTGSKPPGWSTAVPLLVWNPVAGASLYDLDVFSETGGVCDIQTAAQDMHVVTPLTAWSPLGNGHKALPYPSTGATFEAGGTSLTAGTHYCVRIRAQGDTDSGGQKVYGDYTFLNNAFTYNPNAAATGPVSLPVPSDYLSPASGVVTGQTPMFTWKPIAGANSYWVIIARDPTFTTLVDYGFTQIPAYVPRRTYDDETTSYYWAILPAANADGTGLPVDPTTSSPVSPLNGCDEAHHSGANVCDFQKRSTPPTLLSPTNGSQLAAIQPTFQWTPVQGTLNYRIEVSTDPSFGSLLTNVVTGSTGYVSTTTYPAQSTLYWRVQANDGDGTSLTWSSTGTFKQVLPIPQPHASSPSGDVIPTLSWAAVDGAVGYDVHVVLPSGSTKDFHVYTPAMLPVGLSGAGAFHWQVRADFSGAGAGPYSPLVSFERDLNPVTNTSLARHRHALVFSWQGRPGLEEYIVEVATRPDFSGGVETDKTEGTSVASLLRSGAYAKGGKFYWHVEAVDADGNSTGFSNTKIFRLPRHPGRH